MKVLRREFLFVIILLTKQYVNIFFLSHLIRLYGARTLRDHH